MDISLSEWKRIRQAWIAAPGPTPWGIERRHAPAGYSWSGVNRNVLSRGSTPVLSVPMYCYIFETGPDSIGVCREICNELSVQVYDLTSAELIYEPSKTEFPSLVVTVDPRLSLLIPQLESGTHQIEKCSDAALPESLFALSKHKPTDQDDKAEVAIYEIMFSIGQVVVRPQAWFTSDKFDMSYQGVTHVIHEPITGRLVGGGFRLPLFILDESGTQIETSIDHQILLD